jgi:hypothetical protein
MWARLTRLEVDRSRPQPQYACRQAPPAARLNDLRRPPAMQQLRQTVLDARSPTVLDRGRKPAAAGTAAGHPPKARARTRTACRCQLRRDCRVAARIGAVRSRRRRVLLARAVAGTRAPFEAATGGTLFRRDRRKFSYSQTRPLRVLRERGRDAWSGTRPVPITVRGSHPPVTSKRACATKRFRADPTYRLPCCAWPAAVAHGAGHRAADWSLISALSRPMHGRIRIWWPNRKPARH